MTDETAAAPGPAKAPPPAVVDELQQLAAEVVPQIEALRQEMRTRYVASKTLFDQVHPTWRASAANLVDYLTLRAYDLRPLQASLARLGLSSLGRAEEHVITTLERVLSALLLFTGDHHPPRTEAAVGFQEGRLALAANATTLLGPARPGRRTRILVTMPTEAATDATLVRELVASGMDAARINGAHDNEEQWKAMADHIHQAFDGAGRPCRILVDLPGPKLRTGPIQPGPPVLRLQPERDLWGRPVDPVRALLVPDRADGGPAVVSELPRVPVDPRWLSGLHPGSRIHCRDTRGSRRLLTVSAVRDAGTEAGGGAVEAVVAVEDTTYLASGTVLTRDDGRSAAVGALAARDQFLVVRRHDVLTVTADETPVAPDPLPEATAPDLGPEAGRRLRIGCSAPEALACVRTGERVFFDDGRIGGVVQAVRPGEADVRIRSADDGGSKLRAEKGMNFPDTDLRLDAFRTEDEAVLRFAVARGDMVGLSFAQRADDVRHLLARLDELGGRHLGIVLKVETVRGFTALPELLLAAMASPRVGVMVARGDLAVECGYERLAEVQEEMLRLCDAGHVPLIWATEVLDQMARTGRPSRAEISDAVMAARAECVMLNKGPHIVGAVAMLDDILRRMSSHQDKTTALLRRLRSWSPPPAPGPGAGAQTGGDAGAEPGADAAAVAGAAATQR